MSDSGRGPGLGKVDGTYQGAERSHAHQDKVFAYRMLRTDKLKAFSSAPVIGRGPRGKMDQAHPRYADLPPSKTCLSASANCSGFSAAEGPLPHALPLQPFQHARAPTTLGPTPLSSPSLGSCSPASRLAQRGCSFLKPPRAEVAPGKTRVPRNLNTVLPSAYVGPRDTFDALFLQCWVRKPTCRTHAMRLPSVPFLSKANLSGTPLVPRRLKQSGYGTFL